MRALLLCERAPCLQLSPSCLELQPRVRGWLLASVDGETTGSSQQTTLRSSAREETAGPQMWRGSLRPSRRTRRHPKQPQLHKSVSLLQPINVQHLPASCTVHEGPVSSDSLGSAVSPSCVSSFPSVCIYSSDGQTKLSEACVEKRFITGSFLTQSSVVTSAGQKYEEQLESTKKLNCFIMIAHSAEWNSQFTIGRH